MAALVQNGHAVIAEVNADVQVYVPNCNTSGGPIIPIPVPRLTGTPLLGIGQREHVRLV